MNIHHMYVVLKDPILKPQWENETDEWLKHSGKYGYWQSEAIVCLSAKAIEFVNEKCKELFG